MQIEKDASDQVAFTLLEVVTVVFIIAILSVLLVPVFSKLKARAQRGQCTANLKSLYIATEAYMQDHAESWPQIPRDGSGADEAAYAEGWIEALSPYHIARKTWICPSLQNALHNPDYVEAGNARIDYQATAFDSKPGTAHRWPRQPWFAEVGDVHGNGNLIIFTDGSISDLKTVIGSAGHR